VKKREANPHQRWLGVFDILRLQANLLSDLQKVQDIGRHRQSWVIGNHNKELVELSSPSPDQILGVLT